MSVEVNVFLIWIEGNVVAKESGHRAVDAAALAVKEGIVRVIPMLFVMQLKAKCNGGQTIFWIR